MPFFRARSRGDALDLVPVGETAIEGTNQPGGPVGAWT